MYKLQRKLLSQNFLHNRKLVKKLIRSSSIGKNDLVLEIGPGKGIITEQLTQSAQHIIAIELDRQWYAYLRDKFKGTNNLTLQQGDFLFYDLPALPYKVFANIPFAIEGKIIRKLIEAKNSPQDCYLIMMKELAYRLAAPYKENMFSIMHKPWFEFSIKHHFRPTDFTPIPSVDVVLLRFVRREEPLIAWNDRPNYQLFIQVGFHHGLPAFQNLKHRFGHKRTVQVFIHTGIDKSTKPSYITLKQWIMLFSELVLPR